MSVNIGNNEAEQFSNYRKMIDGIDEPGKTDDDYNDLPGDITPDEDDDLDGEPGDAEELDTETKDEIEEEEFKEEINHNFPLSGGGTPLDV